MRRLILAFVGLLLTPFAAAQVIGVQPTPMGMYGWQSTTVQFDKLTNTYGLFPAQSTPQPFAFYGWNSSLQQWIPCDMVTHSCPWLGAAPGGSCGALTDTTNTDCGTGNQAGLISVPPGHVSTFGWHNVTGASDSTEVLAMGDTNYTGDNHTDADIVALGDHNASTTGQFLSESVLLGHANMGDTACRGIDTVLVGDRNFRTCPTVRMTNVISLGNQNDDFSGAAGFVSPVIDHIVSIGVQNDTTSGLNHVGTHSEIVAIGDNAVTGFLNCSDCIGIGDFALESNSALDTGVFSIVAIGDVTGEGLTNGSNSDVLLGVAAGDIAIALANAAPMTETIGIGDSACDNCTADENIAIGDSALDGGFGSPRNNTGNGNIAIGLRALASNTTGAENISIGTNAGCVSCAPNSNGTGNRTGSHNVWIGDEAGQSVAGTTQLDYSIAIGYHARNDQTNEVVIGTPGSVSPGATVLSIIYGNVEINAGTNVVFRCATAGALPAGALTITSGSCGTTTDTGLRVQ